MTVADDTAAIRPFEYERCTESQYHDRSMPEHTGHRAAASLYVIYHYLRLRAAEPHGIDQTMKTSRADGKVGSGVRFVRERPAQTVGNRQRII